MSEEADRLGEIALPGQTRERALEAIAKAVAAFMEKERKQAP